jgi:type IV pilus assembly protein PilO
MSIVSTKDPGGALCMEATARTYRYLDQNEVDAQRKAQAAAAPKQGAKK